MKALKIILLIVMTLTLNINIQSQENSVTPERTPELEAAKQTEKIQKELQLSQEQVKQVHEINLKYARERQISNSRTEALERIKNKDADLKRILQPEQYKQLKNKKYENSTYNSSDLKRTNPGSSNSLRRTNQTPTYRTGGISREPNNERNTSTRQTETSNRSTQTNPTENTRNSSQQSEPVRTETRNTQTNQNTRTGSSSNSTTTNSRSINTNTSRSASSNTATSRNSENSTNSSESTRSSNSSNQNRR